MFPFAYNRHKCVLTGHRCPCMHPRFHDLCCLHWSNSCMVCLSRLLTSPPCETITWGCNGPESAGSWNLAVASPARDGLNIQDAHVAVCQVLEETLSHFHTLSHGPHLHFLFAHAPHVGLIIHAGLILPQSSNCDATDMCPLQHHLNGSNLQQHAGLRGISEVIQMW